MAKAKIRTCYFCHQRLTKEVKMHCPSPACDVCAHCRSTRKP